MSELLSSYYWRVLALSPLQILSGSEGRAVAAVLGAAGVDELVAVERADGTRVDADGDVYRTFANVLHCVYSPLCVRMFATISNIAYKLTIVKYFFNV